MTKERIPSRLRQRVIDRDGLRCVYCGIDLLKKGIHLDHVIPESKGGNLNINNLQPICARCNLSMTNKFTITEWNKQSRKISCCEKFFYLFFNK